MSLQPIPFLRDPKRPPMWLRELTPAEIERWRRMVATQERLKREAEKRA